MQVNAAMAQHWVRTCICAERMPEPGAYCSQVGGLATVALQRLSTACMRTCVIGLPLAFAALPCPALPCLCPHPTPLQAAHGQAVSGADYSAAEPDLLRHSATHLIHTWNRWEQARRPSTSSTAHEVWELVPAAKACCLCCTLPAEALWQLQRLHTVCSAAMPYWQPVRLWWKQQAC